MDAAADRPQFAPPPQPGMLRAVVLAVIAHLLLLVALTFGLHWQRESENTVAEAELWSKLPQEAAPKPVVEPTPPPPAPAPPAPPVVKAPPPPQPDLQAQRDAQIALEREKAKREAEERRLAELQKQKELDRKRKLEAQRKHDEEVARQKEEDKRQLAEAKRKEDLEKEKKRKLQEEQQAKKLAQLRDDTLKRMQAMAGTGAPGSTSAAAHSSGPSATWGARVQAKVRPFITFTDTVSGNPEAVVTVRLAPDGTIVARTLKKSSGVKSWDDAVLRALEKAETLPRDIDGRVPSGGDLVFRPKD